LRFSNSGNLKAGNASAPNNLGRGILEPWQAERALESQAGDSAKPDSGRAYFNLGKVILAMGNRNSAIEQYNILQNIDQDWRRS